MVDDPEKRRRRDFKPNVHFGEKREGAKSFIVSPEGIFTHEDGKLTAIADAVDLFWSEIAHKPSSWIDNRKGYDWLLSKGSEFDREDMRRLLNWLEEALVQKDRNAAVAACKLLICAPMPLLASEYHRMLGIFNSRKVGMVWRLLPDLDKTPLPRGPIPKFGNEAGFGLIRAVPELYLKLAMCGPEMEEITLALAREAIQYDVSLPPELVSLASSPSAKG